MKKLLLTLIVSFAFCGSIFAQYESHWPYTYHMENGSILCAAFAIDGHVYTVDDEGWDALEVAFFVTNSSGQEEHRGGAFLDRDNVDFYGDPYPITAGNTIDFTTPGEVAHFKLWDHINGVLYEQCEVTYQGEPMTIITGVDHNEAYTVEPYDPIILNFTSPTPPTPSSNYWNVPSAWGNDSVPTAATEAIVNGTIIIPADYNASASSITMNPGSVIVIEEGGTLTFTSGEAYVNMNTSVAGWSRDNSGYRLIATPVYNQNSPGELPISGIAGLITDNCDLYKFDQDPVLEENGAGLEWINYNQGEGNPAGFESLNVGQGYLYASPQTTAIIFAGNVNPTVDTIMPLEYTDNAAAEFRGFNLMGNPYTCDAYIDRDFYILNGDGSGVMAEAATLPIKPAEGFFVVAESANETIKFSTESIPVVPGGGGGTGGGGTGGDEFKMLTLNLNDGRSLIDRAMVRFGDSRQLPKYQIGNCSKIYIPKDGSDYAIVSSEGMGEMPVNFKAEKNGTYCLILGSENVSFSYLHLIDNMTGADVDLLANPSYTFEASVTDYASRFRLVFATGDSAEDNFAFFSNGSLIISNDGEATVQVIDLNGRILSSESINGSASISVKGAAGVYMIRLINGDNVKVQKIVVR